MEHHILPMEERDGYYRTSCICGWTFYARSTSHRQWRVANMAGVTHLMRNQPPPDPDYDPFEGLPGGVR